MPTKKAKVHTIKLPIYETIIFVAFDPELLNKKFDLRGEHVFGYGTEAEVCVFIYPESGAQAVAMSFSPDHYCENVLTHESTHAAWKVLDIVNIEVDSTNHEALAYLAGYIAEQVHAIWLKEGWSDEDT